MPALKCQILLSLRKTANNSFLLTCSKNYRKASKLVKFDLKNALKLVKFDNKNSLKLVKNDLKNPIKLVKVL